MIRIRSSLQRSKRPLLVGAALAVICVVLLVAHSGPGVEHMAGMDQGDEMSQTVASTCLAVLAVGVVLAAITGGVARLRRSAPLNLVAPRRSFLTPCRAAVPGIQARAGPALLQVFLR